MTDVDFLRELATSGTCLVTTVKRLRAIADKLSAYEKDFTAMEWVRKRTLAIDKVRKEKGAKQ